ncbi:MAG TPA: cobalamin-dependent protein [Roseiflexaceae bacterium]|nr:cobalamin-dependent protein [Roseiflexaceae bacterium]
MNLNDYQHAFTAALRAGDEPAAQAVVEHARAQGMDSYEIYYRIFAPAMVRIGELWERNELSVAEEHLATAITERLIGRLSSGFQRPSGAPPGLVVLGCVAGERHTLGLRMLSDLLRARGWRVLDLGADVPTADWVRLALRYNADAVALSVNADRRLGEAAALIAELRAALPDLLVLVGGAALDRDPAAFERIGASVYDPDPTTAVERLSACAQRRVRG